MSIYQTGKFREPSYYSTAVPYAGYCILAEYHPVRAPMPDPTPDLTGLDFWREEYGLVFNSQNYGG
jgi:hypothetical protein